jgi:DmsE family decaheme c-type cytochrome
MRFILNVTLLMGLLSFAGLQPAAAQAPATPPAAAGGGPATCLKCHDTNAKVVQILQTPHAVKGDPHSPFGQEGCETCHGPSAAHVASRSNPPDVTFNGPEVPPAAVFKGGLVSSPATRTKQCLQCHEAGLRMNWKGSQHQTNDVACNDCHTIHIAKDPILVKFTQPQKCFTCHAEQRADSFKYSHHPIREGKVVCADCHNPHGSPGPKLLKEFTVNETCYNCHAEKRGPLLWEHEPVRENCLNCHTPHGSTQARLLIQRPPYLCQECHANGGHQSQILAGQNLAGQLAANVRMMARGCVNCHSQVHGSNSPNGAFFTR